MAETAPEAASWAFNTRPQGRDGSDLNGRHLLLSDPNASRRFARLYAHSRALSRLMLVSVSIWFDGSIISSSRIFRYRG